MRHVVSFCLTAFLLMAADPWTSHDIVTPEALAKDMKGPLIIHVGFDVLYRAVHIAGTPYAGPASKPDGIEGLKKVVAGQPRDRDIVIYCGCCPMEKCPNVRPAFAALHALGYMHVRVLSLPENLKTDWTDKGYPVDRRSE
jgi:thiosulfate/3-mercaptopyruvate sulfurtransferase